MADQKKWFKVWASILLDPHFSNLSLADAGRWTRLGALLCQAGDNGKLRIDPPAKMMLLWFEIDTLAELRKTFKRLPHVSVVDLNTPLFKDRSTRKWYVHQDASSGQIGVPANDPESDNGSFIVIMRNWFKYQVDSTAYERVKRSRYKRRGEETLTTTSTSTPRATQPAPVVGPTAARENGKSNFPPNLSESENMSVEEMKRIRIKNLGNR